MMKEGKKCPCENCANGIYMTVENMWWCDKHLKYACQMEKNRLCEKFERDDAVSRTPTRPAQEALAIERYQDLEEAISIIKSECYAFNPLNLDRSTKVNTALDMAIEVLSKKCHNLNKDYDDCDQFVCSNCGIELQDWHAVERSEDDGDITYHEYEFRFCPNCGARIVKEGERNERIY